MISFVNTIRSFPSIATIYHIIGPLHGSEYDVIEVLLDLRDAICNIGIRDCCDVGYKMRDCATWRREKGGGLFLFCQPFSMLMNLSTPQ